MTSTQGKVQLWLNVGAVFLVALLGIIAMIAVNQSTKRTRHTQALLYDLEANARGLNGDEWEALAKFTVDLDLRASINHFRLEILNDLEMMNTLKGDGRLADSADRVYPAAAAYLSAMEEEFALISNDHMPEARELDN